MGGGAGELYNKNMGSSIHEIDGGRKDENDGTTTETTARTRIFVGGLGGTVTADDLRNTFSSLGKIESVEIVRTQGRSFAYFDFLPSFPKSLSKLFSTYNGCKWKGGRLRLEKAKEHYLLRLRQEWTDPAKFSNNEPSSTATKNMGSTEELKNVLNPEKMEIRLFFPKLRKVKELPFKGTGKHKYSFQRVDVPPLPIHFCDCEEHSDPSHTAKGKDLLELEAQGGGLDKKELDRMKSVMNKLFEREYTPKAAAVGGGLIKEGDNNKSIDDMVSDENITDDMADNGTKSVDDLVASEDETDNMTDEDDLVINMVSGKQKETASLGSWGQEVILSNEVEIVDERQASKDGQSGQMLKGQGRKIVGSGSKRKSSLTEQAHGDEFASANQSGRKGSAKRAHLHESAQAIELESITKPKNINHSGSQKFKWRDLAGEKDNNSFSISHIMQSTAPNPKKSKCVGVNVPYISERQNQNVIKNVNLESQSDQINENNELAFAPPNKSNAAVKSARGASWLQKSSWTQLVSEKNSSFSILQLLPGTTLEKQEQVGPKITAKLTGNTYGKLVKSGTSASADDGSKALGVGNEEILTAPDSSKSNMVALDTVVLDPELIPPGEADEMLAPKKSHAAAEQPSVRNLTTGGTCMFMRSAASMREWMDAKAALSGSLKKRNNEK